MGNTSLFPIDTDHWAPVVILTWRKSRISKMLLMIDREGSSDAGTLNAGLRRMYGVSLGRRAGMGPFRTEEGTEEVEPATLIPFREYCNYLILLAWRSKLGDIIFNILWK